MNWRLQQITLIAMKDEVVIRKWNRFGKRNTHWLIILSDRFMVHIVVIPKSISRPF
ncbi:hypothetical protein [Fictibacillus solisalsi]|uniref:hypothetical protein n=1 Tax=Fictibacillus solisalsi TaxID=459525 RepID=UPI00147DC4DD|nr:hypothetical protein [Fictibacillus solisalsi]